LAQYTHRHHTGISCGNFTPLFMYTVWFGLIWLGLVISSPR
jgi:hypothetical protein